MNYRSLVWYSSLAIGEEKNNFVASFLKQSWELLNEEINEEIKRKKLPFNFGIDFLHIQRGEDGLNQLSNKFNEINDPFFTNGHSINKYNPSIIDKIKDKSFFYFPQNITTTGLKDLDPNITKRIFKVSRADQPAKLKFIDNAIQNHSTSKIYFFHQELR